MQLILRSLLFGTLVLLMPSAQAVPQEVHIGVLSFRPLEQTRQQWQATEDYLNAHVRGNYHFTMTPLFLKEMDAAAAERRFDFIRDLMCEEYQGYLFSCPVPADEVVKYLFKVAT